MMLLCTARYVGRVLVAETEIFGSEFLVSHFGKYCLKMCVASLDLCLRAQYWPKNGPEFDAVSMRQNRTEFSHLKKKSLTISGYLLILPRKKV